ncbi:hypothetical protein BD626DRAFT_475930 [Schizophyllum amplum]|uniref:Uncharacterized protein n=1 Tax=Schizophyllum amplum TaxID=97359 RepID=A0A550CYX6_9AGAR|nr:hypothetical protein BD626DRAFT_475930 [Auriculariopsis ampla]
MESPSSVKKSTCPFKKPAPRANIHARRTTYFEEDEDSGAQRSIPFVPPQILAKGQDSSVQKRTSKTALTAGLARRHPTFVPAGFLVEGTTVEGLSSPASPPPPPPAPEVEGPSASEDDYLSKQQQTFRSKFISIPPAQSDPQAEWDYPCECITRRCLKCVFLQHAAKFTYIVNRGPQSAFASRLSDRSSTQ